MRSVTPLFLVLALATFHGSLLAAPQEQTPQEQTLQQVKDLYAQAAYDDALALLAKLPETESATDVGRYRAACLLALGRVEDANAAVGNIVEKYPEYQPDPEDTSRRVIELFRSTRRSTLPAVARRVYGEAKALLDAQDLTGAIARFETLIRLTDDPEVAEDSGMSELKLLGTGFMELARSRAAASTPAAPALPEVVPVRAPVIVAAVPVNQKLPPWTPSDSAGRGQTFSGAVLIEIGTDGTVVSASIEKSVHPTYDRLLLAAARAWVYQPARQDGMPVASSRTVQVVLKPR